MRKSILRFGALALMSAVSIGAFAQSFNEPGYEIYVDGNVYEVVKPDPTGTADDTDFGTVKLKKATSSLVSVGDTRLTLNQNEYKCTEIAEGAFNYQSPSAITIGADVTTIGKNAFAYLNSNVTITFAPGANLEFIGLRAFNAQRHLTFGSYGENITKTITIAVSTETDGNTYANPTLDLSKISDVSKLGQSAFESVQFQAQLDAAVAAVKLGALGSIPAGLFCNSKNLKSVYFIPGANNTLVKVGNGAFYNCNTLADFGYVENGGGVYLPAKLSEIENGAFYKTTLTEFRFSTVAPDSKIKTVGQNAFSNCSWLTTDKFLKLFPVEEDQVTYDQTDYTSIKFTNNEFSFGSSSFEGTGITGCLDFTTYNGFGDTFNTAFKGTGVGYVLLPGDNSNQNLYVTTIENNALNGCTSLKAVEHLDKVTEIGANAFDGCTLLATCALPNGLTTIGKEAFRNAPAYLNIEIPNTVDFIGEHAFYSTIATSDTRIIKILPKESANNNAVSQVIRSTKYVSATGTVAQGNYKPAHYEEVDPVGNYTRTKLIVPMGLMKAYATASTPTSEQKKSTEAQNFYNWSGAAGGLYTYYPIGATQDESDEQKFTLPAEIGETGSKTPNKFYNGCYEYTVTGDWSNKYNATSFSETPNVKLTGINTAIVTKKNPTAGSEYTKQFSGTELNLPKTVVREGENKDKNYFVWYNLTAVDQAALANVKGTVTTVNIQADALKLVGTTVGLDEEQVTTGAFEGFTKLTAVNFGAIETTNATGWYGDNATAPKTVTLDKNAFKDCKELVSFNKDNVVTYGTEIGESAFEGAAKLASFTIPAGDDETDVQGVTTIDANAFKGTALTSINIPASVITIGANAFDGKLDGYDFKGVIDVYVNWPVAIPAGIAYNAFGDRLPITGGSSVIFMLRRLYSPTVYGQCDRSAAEPTNSTAFYDINKFKQVVAVKAVGAKNAVDGRIDIAIDEFGQSSIRIEDNADITDFQILTAEDDVDVTYVRTVKDDAVNKPAPLFVPFSIEQGDPAECGYQIYQVFDTKVYDDKSEGIEYVKVEEGEFTNPNVPYVFYPANPITEFKAKGYTTTPANLASSIFGCSNAASSYEFYGTYATATAEELGEGETMYALTTKGRFAKMVYREAEPGVTEKKDELKALRFYMIQTSKNNPYDHAEEVKFIILDDDDVTAIENVKASSLNAPMFDLQGRQIVAPVKGQVYIQNGVKKLAK